MINLLPTLGTIANIICGATTVMKEINDGTNAITNLRNNFSTGQIIDNDTTDNYNHLARRNEISANAQPVHFHINLNIYIDGKKIANEKIV